MAQYILDSNFFMQAHRGYYPLDVVPSFWRIVKQLADEKNVCSIDKVKQEINKGNDELSAWCKTNLLESFFHDTNDSIMPYYYEVVSYVDNLKFYNQPALDDFYDYDLADAWLISHALAKGACLVTYEKSNQASKKRIKIPDICSKLGISCIDPITMFRQLETSF